MGSRERMGKTLPCKAQRRIIPAGGEGDAPHGATRHGGAWDSPPGTDSGSLAQAEAWTVALAGGMLRSMGVEVMGWAA
jgi:hypothetical protein